MIGSTRKVFDDGVRAEVFDDGVCAEVFKQGQQKDGTVEIKTNLGTFGVDCDSLFTSTIIVTHL
jgi:hypothetical protein